MFENIGGKIKVLAKVLCWIGIVLSVIIAISMFDSANDAYGAAEDMYMTMGIVYLILGPLLSWVGSFFAYGFGELVETAIMIEKNTRNAEDISMTSTTETSVSTHTNASNQGAGYSLSELAAKHEKSVDGCWTCKNCGTKNNSTNQYCTDCGQYK